MRDLPPPLHARPARWMIGAALALCSSAASAESVPAFPGAEGFGSATAGGRGGKVIAVSNLEDSGPGSLRACAEASGPRVCVFRTGGWIVLEASIEIDHPFLTIAGQSAPGDGIGIRMRADNPATPVKVRTHDVILRYLRIRPGASHVTSDTQDALTIGSPDTPVYNVIVDHSSLSWASDEVANVWYATHHVTFQWNIISEGLHCMNHSKGCGHSKGLLVGSEGGHGVSIHHNLFAHHSERSPRIAISGVADVVNNVIYNSMYSGTQVIDAYAPAKVNFVNNYMKTGPDSRSKFMLALKSRPGSEHGFDIYAAGNVGPLSPEASAPGELPLKRADEEWRAPAPHAAPRLTVHRCASVHDCEAFDEVMRDAGATVPGRDAVDRRIIREVKVGAGHIIDAQSEAACRPPCTNFLRPEDYARLGIDVAFGEDGWPLLEPGEPYPDEDEDGMDDRWELATGLDSTADDSGGHALHRDYTNLEVFLDVLTGRDRQ